MENLKKLSSVLEYTVGIIGAVSIIVGYLSGSEGILSQILAITGVAIISAVVLYHFGEKKRGNYYDAKGTLKKTPFPVWAKALLAIIVSLWLLSLAWITLIVPKGLISQAECASGKIAFVAQRDGNPEIYLMNENGANPVNLTNNADDDWEPAWSPDGTRIAFISYRDGNAEIYIMEANGSNQKRITNSPDNEHFPSWSPDGKKIAFTYRQEMPRDIYIIDSDGSNRVELTNNGDIDDLAPAWSPDGSKIAFHTSQYGNYYDIVVMNSNGSSNFFRLTSDPAEDSFPAWSPDGSRIAFVSNRLGYFAIFVMRADGSNPIPITKNNSTNYMPNWSPDGNWIAFQSTQDASPNNVDQRIDLEIYSIQSDGSMQTRLTNNRAIDSDPAWSPYCK